MKVFDWQIQLIISHIIVFLPIFGPRKRKFNLMIQFNATSGGIIITFDFDEWNV